MSYDLIETSRDDARPMELYQLSYTGNFWYYTSADRDVEFEGRTYASIPCSRSDIEPTADPTKADLVATFPRDVGFGEVFRVQPPSEVVSFTLLGKNYLVDSGWALLWKGRVVNSEWLRNSTQLQLTMESAFSSLRRTGLRRRYTRNCPHALYGAACGVSREAFREPSQALAVSGVTVYAAAAVGKPNNYYAGGYVTWESNLGGNTERRFIQASDGASGALVLTAVPLGIAAGQDLDLYPGCDHTDGPGGCQRFSNELRFGGWKIPGKNPFGGSTLY